MEWKHGSVPNVQYVHRFLFLKYNEEKSINAAVARAEKQFADGLGK